MRPTMNERTLRLWAGAEALAAGWGGIAAVQKVTGLSYPTVARGMREAASPAELEPRRIRAPGGGRKSAETLDPHLRPALEALVAPLSRGDPESALQWTLKSTRRLSRELESQGHVAGKSLVGEMLHAMEYSLQGNRKTREGSSHVDRNAQFEYINAQAIAFLKAKRPVISVDTKKKELVGDFRNGGREWRPRGRPQEVRVHDFIIEDLGKVAPYGVYDLAHNVGWVGVGIDHDTAEFAVATITRWWRRLGHRRYPRARSLLITADGGGSNGTRVRLWKWELQKFADRTGLEVTVCHMPPGTSKWNKIEHRLFSFITQNWRGKPLESHAAIVKLIASTTTAAGLKVYCELDRHQYPKGVTVTDGQMAQLRLERHEFHGDWNYTILPKRRRKSLKS
ncbi:MAG: ISAzo13 family transposase [Anaerolineales bacterium]